jgi:predicted RNA binding protein with dsRBD fold (UPF0201 family)
MIYIFTPYFVHILLLFPGHIFITPTMVKQFSQELKKEELVQNDKILLKIEELRKLRRKDLVLDTRRNCLKRGVDYVSPKLNINEYLTSTCA